MRTRKWFAGVDLGKKASVIVVLGAEGEVLLEVRVRNNRKDLRRVFGQLTGKGLVACEATGNAFWLADTLEEMGLDVRVGHTLKIRLIGEARIKTDRIDARVLAELIRTGFFPAIAIPPREIRAVREVLRGRMRVMRLVGTLKNRIHGLLGRHGIEYARAQAVGANAGAYLGSIECAEPVRYMALKWLEMMKEAEGHQKQIEEEMKRHLNLRADLKEVVDRLATIPGVGEFSATLMVLEIWDIERFASAKKLASYVGLVPSLHQSGNVRREGRLTKTGNEMVRWILTRDAWVAIRKDGFYRRLYGRKVKRQCRAKALIPVARALLNAICRVWKEKRTYEEVYAKKAS